MKRKNKKMPTKYLCPIYKVAYEIFINWEWENVLKYLDKYFPEHQEPRENDSYGWCSFYEDKGLCLIWKHKDAGVDTLAHECLHAANRTLHSRAWQPDLLNDEPQTLLMSSLIRAANGDNLHNYKYNGD